MAEVTAIYLRVSRLTSDTRGQESELKRWTEAHKEVAVGWYRDRSSNQTPECREFDRLLADVAAGKVDRIVIWRLDRLGMNARELTSLFDDLNGRGIDLVSLREGFRLQTPAGRLATSVLASVSTVEKKRRVERIKAGQEAARQAGKRWGGSAKGRRLKVTSEMEAQVRRMRKEGAGVSAIARATDLSRPTVYRLLETAGLPTRHASRRKVKAPTRTGRSKKPPVTARRTKR